MNLGKAFRSLFKASPKQESAAGWSFTIQANSDLKRQTVDVYIADEARAEAVASGVVAGLITARGPVPESILADLGVQPGQHKSQAGHGWSFAIQGPPGTDKAFVMVYLSDDDTPPLPTLACSVVRRIETEPVNSALVWACSRPSCAKVRVRAFDKLKYWRLLDMVDRDRMDKPDHQ